MKMEERLRIEHRLGYEERFAKGFAESFAEGYEEGFEEGLAEWEKEGKKKLICKLLLNGTVDMATALSASGLSEEEIKEYLEQMKVSGTVRT